MRAALFASSLVVIGCGKSNATMCEPFTSVGLPQVTRIDRCDAEGIGGETTAKPEAFVAAFAAAGYEIGRDVAEPDYADDWVRVRKGGVTYRVTSTFEKVEQREQPYFSISRDEPRKWMPEATWQGIQTVPAARDKLLEKWRTVANLANNKAPKTCPALGDLDPAMTAAPSSFLLNLDSGDLAGRPEQRYSRGPELFSGQVPDKMYSTNMDDLVKWKANLDALAARRIVPVIRITKYDAPSVPSGYNVMGTFTPGKATFDVIVVDLAERRVLCRSKSKAESSETIEATTTTRTSESGTIEEISTTANAAGDLASNIEKAAFAELRKMSPTFAAN